MEALQIILFSYLIGVNIFGITLLRLQKREQLLNAQTPENPNAKPAKQESSTTNISPTQESKITEQETEQQNEKKAKSSKKEVPYEPTDKGNTADAPTIEQMPKPKKNSENKPVKNIFILLSAVLGGALCIYIGMFILRYKLKSLLFMVSIPTLIGTHMFLLSLLYTRIIFVP